MQYLTNKNRQYILFVIIFFLIVLVNFLENIKALGKISIIVLSIYIIFSYISDRKIRLSYVWIIGFIYVISSEMILDFEILENHKNGLESSKFLITGCCMLLVGYNLYASSLRIKYIYTDRIEFKKISFLIISLFTFLFVLYGGQVAFATIISGRSAASTGSKLSDTIVNIYILSSGLILPALIQYFILETNPKKYRKFILYTYILAIMIIFLMMGTRYYLLFALGGFIVVRFREFLIGNKLRKIILILPFAIVIIYGLNTLKEYRIYGYNDVSSFNTQSTSGELWVDIANKMSPEGVVKMNAHLMDYVDKNGHLYGSSSAFLLYFWVPRSLWSDKPTMIGYWLVRAYEDGFSEEHNASLGFAGDLYADFGYVSYFFLVIIGALLARIERKIFIELTRNKNGIFLAGMVYPATFFFVRSPITTVTSFFAIYIFYKLITYMIVKKNCNYRYKKCTT